MSLAAPVFHSTPSSTIQSAAMCRGTALPFRPLALIAAAFVAVILGGCASTAHFAERPLDERERDEAYAALHELAGDVRQIDKIFILKDGARAAEELAREIARFNQDVFKTLKDWGRTVNLEETGLPPYEVRTRKVVNNISTEELLTAEGDRFDTMLMITQAEAMNYGAALSEVLANIETDPGRKRTVEGWQERYAALHKKVLTRLRFAGR